MTIVGKTDRGLVRSQNQDAYAVGELPCGIAWAVVCDGMGGANGGEIASSMAVKTISEHITLNSHSGMSGGSIRNMLETAINSANISIYEMSTANELLRGMGTTVVTVVVSDGVAYIAHIGDSRAYLVSCAEIVQLTRDHSVVQELVESGRLTHDEARIHPKKNIITRALGVNPNVLTDCCDTKLDDDNLLLICTDGLSNYLRTEEMFSIIAHCETYNLPERLIENANLNGGGDNITVVAMDLR